MKNWLLAISLSGIISGCSADEEKLVQKMFSEEAPSMIEEPTEEELAELMKKEAEPARFADLDNGSLPESKKVKVLGRVLQVIEPGIMGTFTLQADDGIFTIINSTKVEPKEGSMVTVYGVAAVEKADDGTPALNAIVIEKSLAGPPKK
ncbi:hypothetical protein [Domibacillus indicus]|uniref:hypothetical protein n=1 Tax=Domibacillus indicus TaxID=1437523 RepID=UPI000617C3CC|nr:hypothetical protein [Domibacillus indicus]